MKYSNILYCIAAVNITICRYIDILFHPLLPHTVINTRQGFFQDFGQGGSKWGVMGYWGGQNSMILLEANTYLTD